MKKMGVEDPYITFVELLKAGPLLLGWSFSDKDTSTVAHTNAGFATLAMIPA